MSRPGRATAEGTAAFAAHAGGAPGHFRPAFELAWSSIGLGSYLGDADDATDTLVEEAVARAVAGGVNVIDTAANYRYQRAEKSIGRALAHLLGEGDARREEIIVCSKAGYLPVPDRRAWFHRTFGVGPPTWEDDVVDASHCLHPAYIAEEIGQSLANLGLAHIDLYYLHNPDAQAGKVPAQVFEARLRSAFTALEEAVGEGRIGAYGIATWSALRVGPGKAGHISLARAKRLAEDAAGGASHFRYVQLPVNLAMREALEAPTQEVGGRLLPAVAAAQALGLAVVASAAIAQGRVGELPRAVAQRLGGGLDTVAQRCLQFTRSAPGLTSALVGMKTPEHVAENLAVARVPPLGAGDFAGLFA